MAPELVCHFMALANPMESTSLTELASGIDALYLSGRGYPQGELAQSLEALRCEAEAEDAPQPFEVGGVEFFVEPRSFGRYRYRLSSPMGLVGITTSNHLPALRVQPWAEFIHGKGPEYVLWFFDQIGRHLIEGP